MKNSHNQDPYSDNWIKILSFLCKNDRRKTRKRKPWLCSGRDILKLGKRLYDRVRRKEELAGEEVKMHKQLCTLSLGPSFAHIGKGLSFQLWEEIRCGRRCGEGKKRGRRAEGGGSEKMKRREQRALPSQCPSSEVRQRYQE